MNFLQSKQSEPSKSPHLILLQSLTDLQNHCSTFLQSHHRHNHNHNLNHHLLFNVPLLNPNPSHFKTHLESALSNLHNHAKQAIGAGFLRIRPNNKTPAWARVAERVSAGGGGGGRAMTVEDIEERLAGVPVYALANTSEEFVLMGTDYGKALGLFCLKEEDADTLLQQMRSMDPRMRDGSQVVTVALAKVFQLKVDGVAFRLIPEPSQIKNALNLRRVEMQKAGVSDKSFSGVPVFQSRSLVLRSENKSYRPVFFRKEDLENSLSRASREQGRLNPALREGDIQVAVLEDIIQGMKDNATSMWDDVVFIPPGFDVSIASSPK